MKQRIPHDRLFKELLGTFLFEFFQLFLPELAACVDPNSLALVDKELFPEGEGERRADLVARAQVRDGAEERESFFLIHLEHEAQNREPRLFPQRMLQYTLHLHQRTGWDVYPIALVSYSKPKRVLTDRFEIRCAGFEALSFRYRVIQLNRLNWRDYSRTLNPVAAALMSRMGIEPQDRPLVKLACLRLLGKLELPPGQGRMVGRFFENYLRLEPVEEELFHHEFDKLSPREQTIMSEYMTSWHEKGLQQGREEGLERGLEQGLEQGRVEVARRLLDMNLAMEQIQQATGLSRDRIEGLRAERTMN